MHRRVCPQEILQPNEEVEIEDEGEANFGVAPGEEQDLKDSDDSDDENQINSKQTKPIEKLEKKPEAPKQADTDDFSQVKLVSKYAAFVKEKGDGNKFIYYCT